MSIGPRESDQKVELSVFNRLQYKIGKAAETYFADPVHYLFYGTLGLTIAGLFFGMEFSWKFYLILGALCGIEGFKYYQKTWKKK